MEGSFDEQIRAQEVAEEKTIRSFKRAIIAGLVLHSFYLDPNEGSFEGDEDIVRCAVGVTDMLLAELDRTEKQEAHEDRS